MARDFRKLSIDRVGAEVEYKTINRQMIQVYIITIRTSDYSGSYQNCYFHLRNVNQKKFTFLIV